MKTLEFFESLQVGQKVTTKWCRSGAKPRFTVQTVQRVLKTKVVLSNGREWSKLTGELVGHDVRSFSTSWEELVPFEPGHADEVEREKLVSFFHRFNWATLNLDQLKDIQEIITKDETKVGGES